MDFGVATSTRGATSTREGYIAVAEAAERLGFGFLSVNDHVVVPRGIASKYPYSGDHKWAGASVGECLDLITTLAFLAGRTERLQLLSSVMVVPQRQPVLTAKMLASVDILSRGRLIVGCGVGWLKEEFEALSAPPFAERGRVTDEFIEAFKLLWTEDSAVLHGTHVRLENLIFAPKPVRKPHPPIWIGGESPLALQRAVRAGDAWYPASNNPQHRLDSAERVAAGVRELRRTAEAAGRDPASVDVAFLVLWPVAWTAQGTADTERRLLTGNPEAMAADIAALAKAGVRHLCLTFQTGTLTETLERMQRFAEEVMPLVR
jgi:probable F420-dependent oxidoreductase